HVVRHVDRRDRLLVHRDLGLDEDDALRAGHRGEAAVLVRLDLTPDPAGDLAHDLLVDVVEGVELVRANARRVRDDGADEAAPREGVGRALGLVLRARLADLGVHRDVERRAVEPPIVVVPQVHVAELLRDAGGDLGRLLLRGHGDLGVRLGGRVLLRNRAHGAVPPVVSRGGRRPVCRVLLPGAAVCTTFLARGATVWTHNFGVRDPATSVPVASSDRASLRAWPGPTWTPFARRSARQRPTPSWNPPSASRLCVACATSWTWPAIRRA